MYSYHDLEEGNDTSDKVINNISIREQRILITKDTDFFYSFLIKNEPYKLVLVKLGNTSKQELIKFFQEHFAEIVEKVKSESMILLNKE